MERVNTSPFSQLIDYIDNLLYPPRGQENDFEVRSAIISCGSVTRTQLLRQFRNLSAGRLDLITDRLVASDWIERNLSRRTTRGPRTILYELPHDDVYWGSRA